MNNEAERTLFLRVSVARKMTSALVSTVGRLALFTCIVCLSARSEELQYLPEFDANLKVNPLLRLTFEAKGDREAGVQEQFQIGPSVELYLKPLIKLKNVVAFDLNDAKSRFLVLEAGYRDITAPGAQPENRMIVAVTSNFPLKAGFLISDRNRADLDWQTGRSFTWRYRNRFSVQRPLPVFSYHIIPYVAAEPYYVAQYSKWSTTALYAGSLFPVGKHVQFDSYFEHENNTGGKKNKQDKELGIALHLYFARGR
jgi:hypothetical protein